MPARLLPRSLSGRMTLILVLGLLGAQFASLLLHLQERAAMLADGHVHPGMPALDALPLRFIWQVFPTLAAVVIVSPFAGRPGRCSRWHRRRRRLPTTRTPRRRP